MIFSLFGLSESFRFAEFPWKIKTDIAFSGSNIGFDIFLIIPAFPDFSSFFFIQ
jgi:hypothetical protein